MAKIPYKIKLQRTRKIKSYIDTPKEKNRLETILRPKNEIPDFHDFFNLVIASSNSNKLIN